LQEFAFFVLGELEAGDGAVTEDDGAAARADAQG